MWGEVGPLPTRPEGGQRYIDLFQPAVAATAVCYPLYNLIPEIISDENLERSFKRVMANLRSADTRSGNRQREIAVIDGIECSPRMARYVKTSIRYLMR